MSKFVHKRGEISQVSWVSQIHRLAKKVKSYTLDGLNRNANDTYHPIFMSIGPKLRKIYSSNGDL